MNKPASLTIAAAADLLLTNPDYRLSAITGNGQECNYWDRNMLPAILLTGLVKVKATYGPDFKSFTATPAEFRKLLLLIQEKTQANASLVSIAPPIELRVADFGPMRLRKYANAFPLVSDLATYGSSRLRLLPHVGEGTIAAAVHYCALHGHKLAD